MATRKSPTRKSRRASKKRSVASLKAACKAKGLVLNPTTKRCRKSKRVGPKKASRSRRAGKVAVRKSARRSRRASPKKASRRGLKKSVAALKAACKAKGLVLNPTTKRCRKSKRVGPKKASRSRRAGKVAVRKSVKVSRSRKTGKVAVRKSARRSRRASPKKASRRGLKKSVAALKAACKARGLVLDPTTKRCRKSHRGAHLKKSASRKRTVVPAKAAVVVVSPTRRVSRRRPGSKASLRDACKDQGMVYDLATGKCRPSRRGLNLKKSVQMAKILEMSKAKPKLKFD